MCPRSGLNLGYGIFLVNIRISGSSDVSCEMLTCVSTAQARAKCVSAFRAQSGPRHFSCKFPYKVALLMPLVTR